MAALPYSALKLELGGNNCKILRSIFCTVAVAVKVMLEPYLLVYKKEEKNVENIRKVRKGGGSRHYLNVL